MPGRPAAYHRGRSLSATVAVMFPGVRVTETLHEGENAVVYRGQRVADGRAVIVKLLGEDYPTPERVASFRQEFELSRRFSPAPEVCSFEQVEGRWVMVLDDTGGSSLERLKVAGRLSVVELLRLALKITDRVGEVHLQRVIHRDINPANIVVSASGDVRLIDFSVSTLLQRHSAGFTGPAALEGTLAYIAPEQTGRMNRAVDHRADLYSLGVTLYELAVGNPPFRSGDPIELVHSHIAKRPRAPSEARPEIPEAVSRIILKLLAKNVEERYQSSLGLRHDLQRCLAQAERGEAIDLPALGERDVSEIFHVPETLYGRRTELEALLGAFERVSAGACELAVVSGAPGIGKSALVRELYRPVTRARGYFIAGKFDQFGRNVPYSSLLQAFRSLVRLLLAEPPERVAAWRRRLLEAVGPNGQVLIRVIPELGLILGAQPEVPELRPEDAHNRFNLTFRAVIRAFAGTQHPLVLFLDDLQWADHASLELLEVVTVAAQTPGLLVLVAHRSNEVQGGHPALMTLDRIRGGGVRATEVHLEALGASDVAALVGDALRCRPEEGAPLAELVRAKTGGNPFFVGEFLRHLHDDELLELDRVRGRWRWDLEKIRGRNITDNVVELMAQKIGELDADARDVLKVASVLGSRFDLRSVSQTVEQPPGTVVQALWRALQAGFVAPVGEAVALLSLEFEAASAPAVELRFTHDRIQQAVYAMTPEDARPAVHRRIGEHLLSSARPEELPEKIFDIVGHLNHGLSLLSTWEQRERLARLNLAAARRARDASAFAAALNYFRVGAELTADEGWARDYALTFALHLGAAESACLINEGPTTDRLAAAALARARGALDRVKVQQVLIQAKTIQLDLKTAVRMAMSSLRELGVRLPLDPGKLDVLAAVLRTKLALAGKDVGSFAALPAASDPLVLARAEVMANVISAAYRGVPNAFILFVLELVRISVRHGNTPASGFAYACYALILSGALGDVAGALRLVPVVDAMLDLPATRPFKAKTLFALGAFVLPWGAHLRVCADRLYDGFLRGLEVGDLEFAAHTGYLRSYFRLRTCDNLQDLIVDLERMASALRPLEQDRSAELCRLYLQVARNLRGQAAAPARLTGPDFDIERNLAESDRLADTRAIVEGSLQKLIVAFMLGDLEAARAMADKIPRHLDDLPGFPPACESRFWDALVALAELPRGGPERRAAIRRAERDLSRLRVWAAAAPDNYLHMRLLVEAELHRAQGREGDARVAYDQAIAAASDRHLLRDEGVACERAAAFYAGADQPELGLLYLRRAHRCYAHWGANAKVAAIEAASPQVAVVRPTLGREATVHATTKLGSTLDLTSVLRASQAISSEIAWEKLVAAMIKVVMESAGADRAALLQAREGAWECVFEGNAGAAGLIIERGPPARADRLALAAVHYVARTREVLVRDRRGEEGPCADDPYLVASAVRSLLCMPLVNQSRLVGVLYLENSVSDGAFFEARLSFLRMLAAQMAISLENADLVSNLEQMVERRTAELREANASLVASNQELDAFARTVAHDLKNPLGTITGYTRYLLEDLEGIAPDELAEVIGRIERTGEHTVRIVNELLLLASVRKGDVAMVPVEMGSIVQGALSRLDGMIREYKAIIEVPERWPAALGYASWIEEIWANYISNAMKYGGRPPHVWLGADLLNEEVVRFWVRDNGPGIPESERGKVFGEFTRLAGARAEGHGLGLSIVRRIADRLDGVAGFTSEVGQGSVFFFTLRRVRD